MADAGDMILPTLHAMRAEMSSQFRSVDCRLVAIEAAQNSFQPALLAGSLLSKFVPGEFQQRMEAFEEKVERLEVGK